MNAEEPLYQRDPDAWRAHLAEGNATQPRKRVGADILLRDDRHRILLVDPKYKPDWDLPGGMSEANEAPTETVKRELREELGIDRLSAGRMLCVDWVSPHGPWDDTLMFIFDGGQLDDKEISSLKISDGEIGAFDFFVESEASVRLRPYVWRRVRAALNSLSTGRAIYLRDGHPLDDFNP
jgi:8-oxo-dGTP diphosphatase